MIHIFVDGAHGEALYRQAQRMGVPEPVLHLDAWDERRAVELSLAPRTRAVVLPLERLSAQALRQLSQRKSRVSLLGFQDCSHVEGLDCLSWGGDLAADARASRMLLWDSKRHIGGFYAINSMGFNQLMEAPQFDELAAAAARFLKFEA